MPIYEYLCDQCGHRSEEMQRLADPPVTVCPSCGGPYRKLISAPSFQFKGSGWYVTDYARNQDAKGKGEAGQGEAGKGEDSAAKSEGGAKEGGGKEAASEGAAPKAASEPAGGDKGSAPSTGKASSDRS